MSQGLIQYHKHFLVIFLYIHKGCSAELKLRKRKKKKDQIQIFQYPAVRFTEKKRWMMRYEYLHSLLLCNWQITL